MILMALILIIILFLAFFVYFSWLNPHEVAVILTPEFQLTAKVPLVVISCILVGLTIGYLTHLYGSASYLVRDWRRSRSTKKKNEVVVLLQEARGSLVAGDYKKARRLLQKAMTLDSSRTDVLVTFAELALAEGNPGEAINHVHRARKLDPKDLAVLFCQARAHLQLGQREEAAAAYSQVLEIDGDSLRALTELRDVYMSQHRWRDALEMQKRLSKKSPKELQPAEKNKLDGLRFEVACLAREEGKEDQALGDLQSLVKNSPEFMPAKVLLGDHLLGLGRSEEAARIWQEGYNHSGRSVFLSRLEDLAMAEENPTGLLSFYRSGVESRPDDLILRLFYGKFCLRLEMVEEALEQFVEVEKTGADFPWLHLLLAETHVRRRRFNDAIEEYRQAFGGSARFRSAFVCRECGAEAGEWRGRCGNCDTWGTLQLTDYHLIRSAPVTDLREIHHGERQE